MRASDFDEFSALSFAQTRDEMADALVKRLRLDDLMAGFVDDDPICIGATQELRPNVVSLMFFATDRFTEIGLPITRFIVRNLFPKLRDAGVHRIETLAAVDNVTGREWLRTLGLQPETGPLKGYGRRGEEFIQYAWVR